MLTPATLIKYGIGLTLCVVGVFQGGSAFRNIEQIGTADRFSTKPQIISTPQPNRGINVLSGILLISVGGGLIIFWKTEDGNRNYEQTVAHNTANPMQPRIQPRTATFERVENRTLVPGESIDRAPFIPQEELQEPTEKLLPQEIQPVEPEEQCEQKIAKYYQPPPPRHDSKLANNAVLLSEEGSDRYAAIKGLVNDGCVQFIGGKGSGKTEKLGWLIEQHCRKGHYVWVVDPFVAASDYKGLRVFGREWNFQEVARGIREFIDEAISRIKKRGKDENYDAFKQLHIHLAIDEMSNYGDRLEKIDPELMRDFWEICTQFLRQVNMSVSMVSHGATQAMQGGEKAQRGRSAAVKRDAVRILCQAVTDVSVNGNRRCAGWAWKETSEGKERIEIPKWMVAPKKRNYEGIAPRIEIVSEQEETTAKPALELVTNEEKEEDLWAS